MTTTSSNTSPTLSGVPTTVSAAARRALDLDIQGMTCASCAARIEKKLNKLDGVHASVNYATEKAHVMVPAGVSIDELIAVVKNTGYGASEPEPEAEPVDHSATLRRRLIVAAVLAVPVVLLSMVPPLQFDGWQWVSLVLATPVVWWSGIGFHRSAWVNARHGATTMDTLISVGTATAYLWSLYSLVFGTAGRLGMRHEFAFHLMRSDPTGNVYFEAAVGIITFILLGRYIEARSRRQAGSALEALLAMGVAEVTVVTASGEETWPIQHLRVGDVFLVRPGQKVATDGEVVDGRSAVDASLVTGESMPVDVQAGDAVVGGSVNTTGLLRVRATAVGADTQLATIAHLVEAAQTGKANAQRLADKVSGIFVPIVIGLSVVTLGAWLVAGYGFGFALSAAIAVLIIACPCALGLATPTALLAGTGRGAQLGIFIAGPEALERAKDISTVLLDKTGTLTTGRMSLAAFVAADGEDADLVRSRLAALEGASHHPVARAIVQGLGVDAATDLAGISELPGRGVRGQLSGDDEVVAGSPRLFEEQDLEVPESLGCALREGLDGGASPVLVGWGGRARGLALVTDTVKPGAPAALQRLRDLGLRLVMVTGDNESAARHLATEIGAGADARPLIEEVRAGVLPEQKLAEVTAVQRTGHQVAMVGDGVNDAAALAAADLGIAMGEGTDAARAASDITVLHDDLGLVADAVRLSRRTLGTIRANLFWAFAYNVVAIPIAAFGLLNPMIAGAAMAFSSVFVVMNSVRLTRFQPTR